MHQSAYLFGPPRCSEDYLASGPHRTVNGLLRDDPCRILHAGFREGMLSEDA